MDPSKDGGPAFPVPDTGNPEGMSLRDYFAGQALAGLLSYSGRYGIVPHMDYSDPTNHAYAAADAMIAAREAKP